jgi:hypothetical protein
MKTAYTLPLLGCTLVMTLLAGCASSGPNAGLPVLYPNAAYKSMGQQAALNLVQQCVGMAEGSGLQAYKNSAASGALNGATIAGVTGAVGGLVFGRNSLEGVAKSAAQSAVVGAAAGGTQGAINQQPNATYRQYVQRCLSERGLDVIGWN